MERTQRVAKLEALLARVQSRSNRGETHGNAAVAIAQPAPVAASVARIAAAPAPAPVVQAAPPQVAPTPKPSPVAVSAPPVVADPPARPAAHEMQEEVATVVRDVPIEALAAIAAATAQQNVIAKAPPAAGAPPPAQQAAAPPPAAAAPQASVAPAFRGTSAFGGLSKKMTLIGTAPPANWPPRGAEASQSGPPPEPTPAEAAALDRTDDEPKTSIDEAPPAIQATESEGDLDALLGDENTAPPAATAPAIEERAPVVAVTQASTAVAVTTPKTIESVAPKPIKKASRSSTTVIAMIALWLMLIAVIWFVYKSSM